MKQCSKCKTDKELSEFGSHSRSKDGYRGECKVCGLEASYIYKKTKRGLISVLYQSQKGSSKKRNHTPPTYTSKELTDLMLNDKLFHELYDKWVEANYSKDTKPSIDRKDDSLGYTLNNIQIMTWRENMMKYHKSRKPLKSIYLRRCKIY